MHRLTLPIQIRRRLDLPKPPDCRCALAWHLMLDVGQWLALPALATDDFACSELAMPIVHASSQRLQSASSEVELIVPLAFSLKKVDEIVHLRDRGRITAKNWCRPQPECPTDREGRNARAGDPERGHGIFGLRSCQREPAGALGRSQFSRGREEVMGLKPRHIAMRDFLE